MNNSETFIVVALAVWLAGVPVVAYLSGRYDWITGRPEDRLGPIILWPLALVAICVILPIQFVEAVSARLVRAGERHSKSKRLVVKS